MAGASQWVKTGQGSWKRTLVEITPKRRKGIVKKVRNKRVGRRYFEKYLKRSALGMTKGRTKGTWRGVKQPFTKCGGLHMSGGPKERRRGNQPPPSQYEQVFRSKAVLPWKEFWERMSELSSQSTSSFHLQYGHLFPLMRYLIQCEGSSASLNTPADQVKLEELNAFATYFPTAKSVMEDVSWLNNNNYFLLGAHTAMLTEEMKTQDQSVYYGTGDTYGEGIDTKTYQNGDFIVRPSKRMPGKLVASVLVTGVLKHVVIYLRNGKLMIDGYAYIPPPSVSSLRGLVEWLTQKENCEFRKGCGVPVTSDTPIPDTTPSYKSESALIVELTSRLESLGLTASEVRAWNENDIDELLKSTLQFDVIKRNKMKDALKKLNVPGTPIAAMDTSGGNSTIGGATWDGMVTTPATSVKGNYSIRCIERHGVAYRSHPALSSIISPDNGVRYGCNVEVVDEDDTFYRTIDGMYLPKLIDGETAFERADDTSTILQRQLSSSSSSPTTLELNSSKVQISYKNVLGKGSFGTVYEAIDTISGGQRAVKKLDIGDVDQKELHSVRREMELMENLQHENVVRFYGSILTKDHMFLVMELMNQTLQQLINRYSNLSNLVQKYGGQVIFGLNYMHGSGVVHRDIKPSNILVDNLGTAKLSDFGSSKTVVSGDGMTPGATVTARLVGTPMYMAPEIIRAHNGADKEPQNKSPKQADIWSLGCTLLEMHTGRKPWEETNAMKLMFTISTNEAV